MAWIYILLAVTCSLALAHLLKSAEHKNLSRVKVISINYLSATLMSVIQSLWMGDNLSVSTLPAEVWLIAIYLGVMFIVVFLVLSKSIHTNGVGISVTSMRISLLLPVLAGVFYFSEVLSLQQSIGIFTVVLALMMIIKQKDQAWHKFNSKSILLVVLFLATGINDILLKLYEVSYSDLLSESWFTSMLFFTSFVSGMIYLAFKKDLKYSAAELKYGLVIGVINLYSTIFLLYALGDLPASVVFPVLNISVVLGSTMIGIFRWKDVLSKPQWIGILIACISLILLI